RNIPRTTIRSAQLATHLLLDSAASDLPNFATSEHRNKSQGSEDNFTLKFVHLRPKFNDKQSTPSTLDLV
ncbi:hypothetical protein A2U01_0021512, partial [Trifolium medium]|nr:hypothetical protein [Trifolium medium]